MMNELAFVGLGLALVVFPLVGWALSQRIEGRTESEREAFQLPHVDDPRTLPRGARVKLIGEIVTEPGAPIAPVAGKRCALLRLSIGALKRGAPRYAKAVQHVSAPFRIRTPAGEFEVGALRASWLLESSERLYAADATRPPELVARLAEHGIHEAVAVGVREFALCEGALAAIVGRVRWASPDAPGTAERGFRDTPAPHVTIEAELVSVHRDDVEREV